MTKKRITCFQCGGVGELYVEEKWDGVKFTKIENEINDKEE